MRSTLARLSDKELLARLKRLVREERTTTLDILRHLCEVEARGLQLRLGYGSLFDYCTEGLGYSASAAVRRIKTARCLKRFPEVGRLLHEGEVNLTTVALVAPVLEDHNRAEILGAVRGRTQREVEAVVSRYRQPVAYRDRVRSVCVRVPDVPVDAKDKKKTLLSANNRSGGSTFFHKLGEGGGDGGEDEVGDRGSTRIERKVLIQFMASPEFMNKYDEVRSLLSHRLRDSSFESVVGILMEEFIDRHSPTRRQQRRGERQGKQEAKAKRTSSSADSGDSTATRTKRIKARSNGAAKRRAGGAKTLGGSTREPGRRNISAADRDKVYVRDGGRCTYVGSTGKRCGSRQGLQIDHIVPVARRGTNSTSNLRLLCAKHNRLETERLLGRDVVRRFTGHAPP